ncbi:hypothetical protein J6590_039128 [Homalodisca vitripennis]|nr:hypothetical protein J6590_039128 [Homalodisca vitripennis]
MRCKQMCDLQVTSSNVGNHHVNVNTFSQEEGEEVVGESERGGSGRRSRVQNVCSHVVSQLTSISRACALAGPVTIPSYLLHLHLAADHFKKARDEKRS